jgi:hypothetical protein
MTARSAQVSDLAAKMTARSAQVSDLAAKIDRQVSGIPMDRTPLLALGSGQQFQLIYQ